MAEIIEPSVLKTPKPRRAFKATDIIAVAVLLALFIALGVTLLGKLHLQHEVAGAEAISNRVIRDIANKDGADAHSLGDMAFQVKHSTVQLNALFTSAQNIAKGRPVIDRKIVSNAKQAQTVYVIYKYTGGKPYYIRIASSKAAGSSSWHLTGISGDSTETSLIVK